MITDGRRVGAWGSPLLCLAVVLLAGCQHRQNPTPSPKADERVNIGYGTQDQRNLTASVGSLSHEDIKHVRARSVADLIQGRFSGVHVAALPNGDYAIRIRGISSPSSSNEPLYIIDGIQMAPNSGALRGINPYDIERIDILKDAGSTAIYGMRAANGVVMITTKRTP